ncbi:helix-turn-helix domain-containing protein [Chitinibacter bivalviorum]|uniref:Helix-turn-helix domain-containing protein n=1 Tax=Chitinibacter bivalviorum TaxID=2739434 RepID=A0A7H9BKA9_9NEIS|nr:helix-turn-helix domain-containing protein [Chitinibacter bivalviorum]QLG87924.1 helix-turn-helix domain-containing protein [Chitinibacter bivalviorum]
MTDQIENTANNTFLPAGRQLRLAREAKGLSVDDIAGQLKLARRQIEAIEKEAFDELPSNLFIRGFVRNYARLVGLDVEPLLQYLATVLPEERVQSVLPSSSAEDGSTVMLSERSSGSRSSLLLIMSLIGMFIGVAAVYWYLQQPSSPDLALAEVSTPEVVDASVVAQASSVEVAAVASVASAATTVAVASAPIVSPNAAVVASAVLAATPVASKVTQAASVVAGEVELALMTESDSWVQIVDANGNKVMSEIVRPGFERKASGKPPFSVKIGNAPKTKLFMHGQPVDLNSYIKPGSDVVNLELK